MANLDEPRLEGRPPAVAAPFVFYSAVHGRLVVDATGAPVGRVADLAVALAETFPPVTALLVRRGRLESFSLTARWRDVETIDADPIRLAVGVDGLVPGRWTPPDGSFWVGHALLDRQIVDTAGAKVVRVNDLHFLRVATGDLHLVHVDVGFRGLVRRLGWGDAIDAIVRRVSPHAEYLASDRLVSWRYVQPLTRGGNGDALHLSITRKDLRELHPAELADILTELDGRERESVFAALDPESAAEALTEVEPGIRERLIGSVPPEHAADILEEMPPDEAADLLSALPEPESDLLLQKMERNEAKDVEELLRYGPYTAGGMMTTELIALPAGLTAGEALERLRSLAADVEHVADLYVVDAAGRLDGRLTIRGLLLADPGARLDAIMERDCVCVHADDPRARVAEVVEKYNLLAVPVTDEAGKLLGIVTVDDVLTHMTALAWKWKLGRSR